MNSYFYCHRRNFQHFKTSVWSHLICGVKNKGFCPSVPLLTCLCVTNASDGSQESSRRVPSHCQILYVYKSAVPFFCADLVLSLWMKTPPRSHPSILWWKNACPALLKDVGASRCILTAPSSTRNGCWLSLTLLGTPTLFTVRSRKKCKMYMHVFLHMSVCIYVFCKVLKTSLMIT